MTLAQRNQHPLHVRTRPSFETGHRRLSIVDLFSGCGGLTLGTALAAHSAGVAIDVKLAIDNDPSATQIYKHNFPAANVVTGDIDEMISADLGYELMASEHELADLTGATAILVGGPPCQGHSNLNNHTRRDDPKNRHYLQMARAALVLKPQVVLIENVPSVTLDKSGVVQKTVVHLRGLGYQVHDEVVKLATLGVPQKRKRHILLATLPHLPSPAEVFAGLTSSEPVDIHWAISDLCEISRDSPMDVVPRATAENLARMQWLIDNDEYDLPNHLRPECHRGDHSYKSMYGRMKWSDQAQTVTSGYGSPGQGRYVHPDQPRALTAHEAARLQGFPDFFHFDSIKKRTHLAVMIGNAVPPQLAEHVIAPLVEHLAKPTALAEYAA